jgi:uncharacterized membrane protein (DUF485 family)
VLGRISPEIYDRFFIGSAAIKNHFADQQKKNQEILTELRDQKASEGDIAILAQKLDERLAITAAEDQKKINESLERRRGWLMSLMAAVAMVMILEAFLQEPDAMVLALVWARYLLLASWAALVLAQPTLLRSVSLPWAIGFLVLAVSVVLPVTGVGKKKIEETGM